MPETTPLIKAALNLRVGAGFDVYNDTIIKKEKELLRALLIQFCKLEVVYFFFFGFGAGSSSYIA